MSQMSIARGLETHERYRLHVTRTLRIDIYNKIGEQWMGDERPTVIYHGTVKEDADHNEVRFSLSVVIALLNLDQVEVGEYVDNSRVPPNWGKDGVYRVYEVYHGVDTPIKVFERETFTPGVKPVVVWRRTE